MKLADSRRRAIASSPTMKVTATVDRLRREGVDVIDFGAGEPDFATLPIAKTRGARGHRRRFQQVHAGAAASRSCGARSASATGSTTASSTRNPR